MIQKLQLKRYVLTVCFLLLLTCLVSVQAQNFTLSDFSTPREITTISNTTSGGVTRNMIAYGDFNADGKNDIVKVGVNQVLVLENIYTTGDISNIATNLFNNLTPMATASGSKNVVVADINLDGKKDILVGCDTFASIFINNSSGGVISFNSRIDIATYGSNVELFDIDGDGYLDLIHSKKSYFTKIGINLNDQTGSLFTNPTFDFTVTYGSMEDWTFGDFDGNGSLDFFSARADSNSANTGIYISKNISSIGSISFEALTFKAISGMQYASYGSPKAISCTDIDGDSKPDALVQLGNKTHFFLNTNSTGVFDINNFNESNIISQSTTSNFALNFGIGDINKDGKIDVIAPGSNSSGTFVMQNNSTLASINFNSPLNVDSITNQTSIIVDLDGDNAPEIINARYYSDKIYVVKYTGAVLNTQSLNLNEYRVYPNPVKKNVTIKFSNNLDSTISIYTITGKHILSKPNTIGSEMNLNISSLKAGLYVLKIENETGTVYKKIIKE
jgi:Secretion system C-terminal sorting domain/FG-GAP-like repeat